MQMHSDQCQKTGISLLRVLSRYRINLGVPHCKIGCRIECISVQKSEESVEGRFLGSSEKFVFFPGKAGMNRGHGRQIATRDFRSIQELPFHRDRNQAWRRIRGCRAAGQTLCLTVANLTLIQPVQLWVDTAVNALSPTNPHKYYRVVPGG